MSFDWDILSLKYQWNIQGKMSTGSWNVSKEPRRQIEVIDRARDDRARARTRDLTPWTSTLLYPILLLRHQSLSPSEIPGKSFTLKTAGI